MNEVGFENTIAQKITEGTIPFPYPLNIPPEGMNKVISMYIEGEDLIIVSDDK